jgi:hypothetical protein
MTDVESPVTLTIYGRPGLEVCSRILQALTMCRVVPQTLVFDFNPPDVDLVRTLAHVDGPVMRLSLTVSLAHGQNVERVIKRINRLVDVYTVLPTAHHASQVVVGA